MFRKMLPTTFLFLLVLAATPVFAQRGPEGPRRAVLPTVDEMAQAVSANAEQRAQLAEARLAFFQARPSARGGHGPAWTKDEDRTEPPLMAFLGAAAVALDTGQMIELVDLLEAERPATPGRGLDDGPRPGFGRGRGSGQGPNADSRPGNRCGDGPGNGPGFGRQQGMHGGAGSCANGAGRGFANHGGRGSGRGQGFADGSRRPFGARGGHGDEGRLIDELSLNDEQKTQVQALYASTIGGLMALRRQVAPGEEPSEAVQNEASRLRAEHQARLKEILTDEQQRELAELQDARRAEHLQQAEEWRTERRERRLQQLDELLDLSSSQKSKIAELLEANQPEPTVDRSEAWAEGGPMPNLFAERGNPREQREKNLEAITEVLDPQQRELFAKLQTLGLEARGGGAHRFGRRGR